MAIVNAKKREANKHAVLTELRDSGFIPAVVYGYKVDTTPIAVNELEFEKTLREDGRSAVMSLNVDGEELNAVVAEIQKDPVKGNLLHLDFLAVNMNKKIELEVPVLLVGEAIGVKEGGSLQQPNIQIILNVEPSNVPENVEVDISALKIGELIAISDIRDSVEYEIVNDDDFVLVTIQSPVSAAELEPSLEAGEVVADTGSVEEKPAAIKED